VVACTSGREGGEVTREGQVGDACDAYAQCVGGLDCVDALGPGYCTRPCGPSEPCPQDGTSRCVWLTNGDAYCLRQCTGGDQCSSETTCTPLRQGGFSVCFP
jgi:hypothetical protein